MITIRLVGLCRGGKYQEGDYLFGFNGMERDDELKGEGNSVNYKYRMHDPRIGRFSAVDPLVDKYPWNSPYAFSENKVIRCVELEGLEIAEHGNNFDPNLAMNKLLYESSKDWMGLQVYLGSIVDKVYFKMKASFSNDNLPNSTLNFSMEMQTNLEDQFKNFHFNQKTGAISFTSDKPIIELNNDAYIEVNALIKGKHTIAKYPLADAQFLGEIGVKLRIKDYCETTCEQNSNIKYHTKIEVKATENVAEVLSVGFFGQYQDTYDEEGINLGGEFKAAFKAEAAFKTPEKTSGETSSHAKFSAELGVKIKE